MWQLLLLSRVIPVFKALADEFKERDVPDRGLADDALGCYSDIINIGQALFMSHGEWNSGLRDDILVGALEALETRLPKSWFCLPKVTWAREQVEEDRFPRLRYLYKYLKDRSLGGFNECLELPSQPVKVRNEYLGLIGRKVSLFHRNERQFENERRKFVNRIKFAATHLLNIYCRDTSAADVEEFSLSQHPSHGTKESANRVYKLLERHWNCRCSQHKSARSAGGREARLSLIRYRQLMPKVTIKEARTQRYRSAKFEVLLPICKEIDQWKVTNIEIKKKMAQSTAGLDRHLVNNDICQLISDSDKFQVDFLVENDSLWHLTPEVREGVADCYTVMENLNQLLGDDMAISDMAKYTPQEKLTLCYILANSMLFLYPGSWLHSAWSSTQVYFARHINGSSQSPMSSSSLSPVLTFPYLSVELQDSQQQKPRVHHMQYHRHPAVLGLGIIFLEIATGTRFNRSREKEMWKASNSNGLQVLNKLSDLERQSELHRSKRISPALHKAIRACVKLEPPPSFISESLAQEGPIRQYILSCIIQPLALELRDGYKVRLEELDKILIPEKAAYSNKETTNQQRHGSTAVRQPSSAGAVDLTFAKIDEKVEMTFEERHEICLAADDRDPDNETRADQYKVSIAKKWFEYHRDATSRIRNELRNSAVSDVQRIKIAILDSGLELSSTQKAQYGFDSYVDYRSFVDQEDTCTQWKDEVGHGTHLAVLLRQIAENAIICVARVFRKKPHAKSAESIAEALRYAVDQWQVDIVVISFGFGKENDTLAEAIAYASYKNVIMFAAASNDGKNRPRGVAWPASRTGVFCVHAADGLGNPSPFTPSPQDNMHLMTLGECVRSAWPPFPEGSKRKTPDDSKLMSGTSCAAPIAAGIAAIILDYGRGFLNEEQWRRLRRYDSIQRMFKELKGEGDIGGYWWIKYWTLFDPDREETWIQGTIKGFTKS